MAARAHDPSTLGPVDAIDVVALDADSNVGRVNEYMRSGAVGREIRLTDREDVERIAALWRSLPPGEQARCHIPPYGLRFWRGGVKVLEASLCWECHNVFGHAGDQELWFAFDATAPLSVSLLMQCRQLLP